MHFSNDYWLLANMDTNDYWLTKLKREGIKPLHPLLPSTSSHRNDLAKQTNRNDLLYYAHRGK